MSVTQATRLLKLLSGDKSFNRLFNEFQIVSATDKCLSCRFKVEQSIMNSLGSLHGGFIATAADVISSVDLSRSGSGKHVSVHLGVEYLRPALVDSWVKVDSYVLKQSNRLAFCDIHFIDESTGKLLARGSHTKFIVNGPAE